MKYLFITLKVQDGEREHTHRVLETTNCKNIIFAAEYYAAHYWGHGEREIDDDWWWFRGEFALQVYGVIELNRFEFEFASRLFGGNKPQENNYFNIVHAGYREESQREEIQIHTGENGNMFLYPTDEGFIVDVYNQNDIVDTMGVLEDDLKNDLEDDTVVLHPEKNEPKNFSEQEIKDFKEEWGQTHEEICSALCLDKEGAEDVLREDNFWHEKDQKWYPTFSSMFSEREQEIADYLMYDND